MEVMIANSLEEPIHIAVVKHSPQAIEFVISPQRVPIPCGAVKRHDDIEPDHALVMSGFDAGIEFSATFEGYAGTMRAVLLEGKAKDGPFWRLTLLELRTEG